MEINASDVRINVSTARKEGNEGRYGMSCSALKEGVHF
jgi:hypothetical protein